MKADADKAGQELIHMGPLPFTETMLIALFGALSLLALAIAASVGVEPGSASSLGERVMSMHVIWAFQVMATGWGLSYFCSGQVHLKLRILLRLVGSGLLAGALISAFA
jgi:hypothetical protein